MQAKVFGTLVVLVSSCCPALAATDKFNITPAEHLACDVDATTLCSDSADEDQVVACMKTKRALLSATCLSTFNAGLRKRHMPL